MATKKQKRIAGEIKAAKELEETRRSGLAAQQRDRERRARLAQQRKDQAEHEEREAVKKYERSGRDLKLIGVEDPHMTSMAKDELFDGRPSIRGNNPPSKETKQYAKDLARFEAELNGRLFEEN